MFYVDLSKVESVKRFVKIANTKQAKIILKENKYSNSIDGKNIFEIISLNLSSPIKLEISDNDYTDFEIFRINSIV